MSAITWIDDPESDGYDYVVHVMDAEGLTVGWAAGKLDIILDMLSDGDHADAIGEDRRRVAVFVLAYGAPIPCRITRERQSETGMIKNTVSWRAPKVRGLTLMRSETGYTKIMDF